MIALIIIGLFFVGILLMTLGFALMDTTDWSGPIYVLGRFMVIVGGGLGLLFVAVEGTRAVLS